MNPKEILAIGVGYGAGIWFSILALKKMALLRDAERWASTRGRILESCLYRDEERNTIHFRIRYEFTAGEKIEGKTPRLAGDWFWTEKQQAAFVSRYGQDQEVEVFFDTRDPRRNCLDRRDGSGVTILWIIAIGGPVLASMLVWLRSHGEI